MPQASIPLVKRTKQEILDEYEKLQDQLGELQSLSKTVHSQPAADVIDRAKARTPQTVDRIFSDFQAALHAHVGALRGSLLEQTDVLQEMQKAVELSRQQLQLQHHVTVAAEALDELVAEHARRTQEFDAAVATKKKAWDREVEEYEYQKKVKRERDQVETEEREKTLALREAAIKAQEQEIAQMKRSIEQYPRELEAALAKREQETVSRMTQQFAHEQALAEKEAAAQIRLLQLTVKNLEERVAAQADEVVSLKHAAEEANAKAQALAIKAIERPTTIVAPTANPPSAVSYHDRGAQNGR